MAIRRIRQLSLNRLRGVRRAGAIVCIATAGVLFAGACDRGAGEPTTRNAGVAASDALPADLFLKVEPAGAKSVLEVKRTAKAGDEIVVRGRIGGSKSPFVEGRAIFTLTDMSLPPCNANPEDKCATPWDYCCEPADRIAAHSLTAQIAGADGQIIRTGLQDRSGLSPLANVIMKARVVRNDGEKSFVVTATSLFVSR